ncbi:MAG: tryptophan synthase subunit alpha [Nitrospirae bacterium]|nr:tryptophan synthase subunit alpha [Nitrospirota bacterium]MBF0535132.1 tryptophan synthase subunit alpha [Nitrospirota bacterium]MBF0615318.1 tryptophan synthase subunit alpha [Nitrospirota bacterium]
MEQKTRISRRFEAILREGKKAFIPYIMAGCPSIEKTEEWVLNFSRLGCDIVELGVPFSDPLADGPAIQAAADIALKNGVTLRRVLSLVAGLRKKTDIAIILMTYFNPVFKYGMEHFILDAVQSGVDGVIVPDLPPDEEPGFRGLALKNNLDTIYLLAPTSTEDRIQLVAEASRGFIYYVSLTGITGSTITISAELKGMVEKIKRISGKPVAVGFGIKSPEDASEIAAHADGVIIGSSIVSTMLNDEKALTDYIISLRKAI